MKIVVWFVCLMVATAGLARAQCGTPTIYKDMYGRVLYQDGGKVWLKLYNEEEAEGACTWGNTVELDSCSLAMTNSYLWIRFVETGVTFTPGVHWNAGLTPSSTICPPGTKYRVDPKPSIVPLIRAWAETGQEALIIYVGEFTGTPMPAPGYCGECNWYENYYATQDIVRVTGVEGNPLWYTPWHFITTVPGGCRPECPEVTEKPELYHRWGAVKELYR